MKKVLFTSFYIISIIFTSGSFAWSSRPADVPRTPPDTVKIQGLMGSGYSVVSYDPKEVDNDIRIGNGKGADIWTYENGVQAIAERFDKKNFLTFIQALKKNDIKKATNMYTKYWSTISPFLPIGGVVKQIWSKSMKHSILILGASWQDWLEYYLEYIFYKNGRIYSIKVSFLDGEKPVFVETYEDSTALYSLRYCTKSKMDWYKCPILERSPSPSSKTMRDYFISPEKNKDFSLLYYNFLSDLQKLWK